MIKTKYLYTMGPVGFELFYKVGPVTFEVFRMDSISIIILSTLYL